ncbi:hypothetical protein GF340_00710 [Candidatus Peregrinibacteria bacterium]|nr:hypothetical protein [Candidatus Peregrinibacteria bacterium]
MITTLISLVAAGTLGTTEIHSTETLIMPWNETVLIEETTLPSKQENKLAPVLDAKASLAVDLKSGLILHHNNIHKPLYIASLTKLMTAIIIIEEHDLSEKVIVPSEAVQTEGSKIWLYQGEEITVENLLYASLINSGNDAAIALAIHNSGSVAKFVDKMNEKAEELNLTQTTFINPTGLDESSNNENTPDGNISTAYDLALLGRYAYGKSFIRRAVSKKEYEIESTDGNLTHKLESTNRLLDSYLNVLGLKTGTTDKAGECLITIINNGNERDILTVVLNSPNRYQETKVLAEWSFNTYTW